MYVMRMHENDGECLRMSHIQGMCVSFTAESHYTTCMIMNGNSSDYLIMDEHVCDENA